MTRYVQALAAAWLLVTLSGCSSPQQEYCKAQGAIPANIAACVQYYEREEAAFNAELAFCNAEADQTYPPSLYSDWGTALVHRTSAAGGGWSSVEQVTIPPDTRRNAELNALRRRIIDPCMQKRGWNSGAGWQDGRRLNTSQMDPNGGGLPWLHVK